MKSQVVEDYLRAIYEIQQDQGKVATGMLANDLGITPASVSGMIKKLAEANLVSYEPYKGVVLTAAGQKIALAVLRRHRLVELFLTEVLGVPWDQVHEEAHKIEHVLSDDLVERIDTLLGHPRNDAHGAPIPDWDGAMPQPAHICLADLEAGQFAVIDQVSDRHPALLRYLDSLQLYPGTKVKVVAVEPFDGPLTIRVGKAEHVLGLKVARQMFVTRIRGPTPESLT